jgi:hypothetical protein
LVLLLLVAEAPIVHDAADRRAGIGGDLNEIKPSIFCDFTSLAGGHYTELLTLFVNDSDLRDPDLMIDSSALFQI